ncbi:cytochrome P450 82C2-like [Herrania umbratica]|uniref:Cytochrome P450 82C2-like n=1 Tax=Herrania umbratica TaxID=108875 RepID=A0A6J1BS94_9ROSI|nr:cytochrome P450 82C2-like [Herrania umbratica]
MVFSSHLFAIAGFLGLVLFYKLWKKGTPSHQSKGILLAPKPPGALPFIGHIHLLGGQRTLAQTLGDMADKCGPIFSIRLGAFPALIISNREAVKECFTTNDRVLARQGTLLIELRRLGHICRPWLPRFEQGCVGRQNLFVAGADTTSVALTWILSNLMNNRHALKTAQEELDLKVRRDKWVQDSDIEKLVYLQAVIKETLRLYPPGPVSFPHEAREDCSISRYHVQKGTRVILNLRRLHRDPRIWSNPDEFQPKTFLTSNANVDVLGQHFELIPFGSGRRSCPGMTLALQTTHLTIARTLQGFDLTTPFMELVDMTEGLGITMPKATPLDVLLSPRLPARLLINL